jgi:hypothetical protein
VRPLVLALALLAAVAAIGAAEQPVSHRPDRSVSLPPDQVKDTFFGYFLGILFSGMELEMDNGQMREVLSEFKTSFNLPFDLITRVWQTRDPVTGAQRVGLEFRQAQSIPVPFSLLFYHPGSIVVERALSWQVSRSSSEDPGPPPRMSPVYDLALVQGSLLADIDGWLETLFSSFLEDTWIRHVFIFTWRGDWMAYLQGTGRRTGRTLGAYFNFTHNRIVFPVPADLDRAARGFPR